MAIRLKLARSAKELDDAFWLRYEVYTREEGYFGERESGEEYLTDRFDAHPYCANIIAYDGTEPVGTLRVNADTGAGLPANEYYDFSKHRRKVTAEWKAATGKEARICSAGMLAIRAPWRNRRDVILALFKMAGGIAHAWGVTHVIATVNYKSHKMYERIGFVALEERLWIEQIGEHIVPMAIPFEEYYRWAMGDLLKNNRFLELFFGRFQRIVMKVGECIFTEGEEGNEAYVVDSGTVKISRKDKARGEELTLITLSRGDLFGELALIDNKPRSASAVALTNVELLALDRDNFLHELQAQPIHMHEVLELFAERIRRMDELAVVLAYGSVTQKLEHALQDIRQSAVPHTKRPGCYISKVGPRELAQSAGVDEGDARSYLERQKSQGRLEYSETQIKFLEENEIHDLFALK